MVDVVQLVRAPDCGSGGRRFESGHPPHFFLCIKSDATPDKIMGYRQAVRHRSLTPTLAGSNPATPAIFKLKRGGEVLKKTLKVAAFVLSIVMLAFSLLGCTRLSGTYSSGLETGVPTEYSFSGRSVVISVAGIESEGTYRINGDELIITIGSAVTTHSFQQDGESIIIDGIRLTKK